MRLVTPRTLVGLTALSVETLTKRRTPEAWAALRTFRVPKMLFSMPSSGCFSR